MGTITLVSLLDMGPTLCLFLTSLISHHANPQTVVVIKSTFSRFLMLCERITKRSPIREGRRKSSGKASVSD